MRKLILLFIIFLLSGCSEAGPQSIVKINKKEIKVEIVDTVKTRYQGLSERKSLCEDCGMLFKFDDKQIRTFVVRNMFFPIDIIWINNDQIIGISKNLLPEGSDYKNYYKSPDAVNHVLEVNAVFTDKNNIKIGDIIKYEL